MVIGGYMNLALAHPEVDLVVALPPPPLLLLLLLPPPLPRHFRQRRTWSGVRACCTRWKRASKPLPPRSCCPLDVSSGSFTLRVAAAGTGQVQRRVRIMMLPQVLPLGRLRRCSTGLASCFPSLFSRGVCSPTMFPCPTSGCLMVACVCFFAVPPPEISLDFLPLDFAWRRLFGVRTDTEVTNEALEYQHVSV